VTAQGLQVAAVLGAFLTVFLWVAAPNLVAAMRGEGPVALCICAVCIKHSSRAARSTCNLALQTTVMY
jgi:hypothetical protein